MGTDNAHLLNNLDSGISTEADNANEHIGPGIRMGDSTVMLSTCATLSVNSAKHLDAQRDRPFASLRVTLTRYAAQACTGGLVRQTLRFAQGDSGGADSIIRLIF